MRNAGLEETQAGIKIAGRNINNLRYADDTTLMAEREEELTQHKLPVAFCISKGKSGRQLQGRQTWLVSCLTPALAKRLQRKGKKIQALHFSEPYRLSQTTSSRI